MIVVIILTTTLTLILIGDCVVRMAMQLIAIVDVDVVGVIWMIGHYYSR